MRFIRRKAHAGFSIFLIICCSQSLAAESDLTRAELQSLLQERDAAIIELQHTIRDMMTRLETVERSMDPAPPSITASRRATSDAPGSTSSQQGFSRLEVDEQAAQRALERTLVEGGALLLPAWTMQIGPSLVYTQVQSNYPVAVADDNTLLLGTNTVERNVITANLDFRFGLPFDSQLELGLPYVWVEEETRTLVQGMSFGQSSERNGEGIGSLRVGLAKTFLRERGLRPDLVGRVTWDTGSGDRLDNGISLGGHESISGSLTLIKRTDPSVYFGSVSYRSFRSDGEVELGDQLTLSLGTALAVSPDSSLFASINNSFIGETKVANVRIDGSDITSAALRLGASTIVSRGFLLNLTADIGISENAPDYSIGLSASLQTDALRNILNRQ
jgi:hypothetical protein